MHALEVFDCLFQADNALREVARRRAGLDLGDRDPLHDQVSDSRANVQAKTEIASASGNERSRLRFSRPLKMRLIPNVVKTMKMRRGSSLRVASVGFIAKRILRCRRLKMM